MNGRLARWRDGVLRLLTLVAKPVRRAQGRGGVVVEPYRGYGSDREAFLIGRVFRQTHAEEAADLHDLWAHLRDIARRIRRRALAGVPVTATLGTATSEAETDRDGYYRVHLNLFGKPAGGKDGWHAAKLTVAVGPIIEAETSVFIPPPGSRFVVVSDIDDTVMHTGVANKLAMLWRLFVARAESRVAFSGVAAFYRALHHGVNGGEANPILYVSRAPWGTYDMLTTFFRAHDIPVGPELFLREWGLSWRHPWPRRASDHKCELIDNMLALYPDMPFVLIGDSGQHDPEVYADIVQRHAGRVTAIYIRDVTPNPQRRAKVERLARNVAGSGSTMVLAADCTVMAEHAAVSGLIGPEWVSKVAADGEVPTASGTTFDLGRQRRS